MMPSDPGVPPAFRARTHFVGKTDDQVLDLGAAAFRARDWPRFDDAMSELSGRAERAILQRLRALGVMSEDGRLVPEDGEPGAAG